MRQWAVALPARPGLLISLWLGAKLGVWLKWDGQRGKSLAPSPLLMGAPIMLEWKSRWNSSVGAHVSGTAFEWKRRARFCKENREGIYIFVTPGGQFLTSGKFTFTEDDGFDERSICQFLLCSLLHGTNGSHFLNYASLATDVKSKFFILYRSFLLSVSKPIFFLIV